MGKSLNMQLSQWWDEKGKHRIRFKIGTQEPQETSDIQPIQRRAPASPLLGPRAASDWI
jgi:hypothetical protein